MKQILLYSFKVFSTTAVFSPLLLGLTMVILDPVIYSLGDIFSGYLYMIPISLLVLLLPGLIMSWIIKLLYKRRPVMVIKIFLSVTALPLTIIALALLNPYYLFRSNYWQSVLPLLGCYTATLIGCIWVYKLSNNKCVQFIL
jgi:hypothetical protein